jgi:uncharacterized repeat protein (TIGR01451 family)
MRRTRVNAFSGVVFVILTGSYNGAAVATDYYVDAVDGNDTWSGTTPDAQGGNGPWRSVGRVNGAALAPGDTVAFRRGQTWTVKLNVPRDGAPGNPITFGAYGEGAKPVIDVMGGDTQALVSYRSYITVRDMVFKNSTNTVVAFAVTNGSREITLEDIDVEYAPGTTIGNNGIAFTKGGRGIHLSGVRVVNAINNGIVFLGSATDNIGDVVVENSVVLGTSTNDCFTVHEDASLNPAGSNFVFRNNYAERCAEQGYDITSGSNILLEDNVSRDCGEGSILIGHSAESIVIDGHESYDEPVELTSAAVNIKSRDVQLLNSVISGNGYHLLSLSNGTKKPTENIRIVNNTFVWNGGGAAFDVSGTPENVQVLNNIFTTGRESFVDPAGLRQYIIRFLEPTRPPEYPGFVFDNNLYFAPDGVLRFVRKNADGSTSNFDFAGFNAYGREIGGQTLDPLMVDRTAGDYRLTAGSPAIDRGVAPVPAVNLSVDHDDQPRSGNPDVGAYEFQSADIGVSAGDYPAAALTDEAMSYTFTVVNNGPMPATGVIATVTLPVGVTGGAVASQGGCTGTDTITCALDSLGSGQGADITITATAAAEPIFDTIAGLTGNITVSAAVSANETDTVQANDTASVDTAVMLACQGKLVTRRGTSGADGTSKSRFTGGSGADVIHTLGGNDWIDGKNGDDTICGGAGDDDLLGGAGNDGISGGSGFDTCNGGSGTNATDGSCER